MSGHFATIFHTGTRCCAAAIVLVVAMSLPGTWACGARGRAPLSEVRLEISTAPTSAPQSFAIAPDGQQVTFVATYAGRSVLWVRDLNTANAHPLPGTAGALAPFWSPDSRAIGFFAADRLKSIEIATNSIQTIANATEVAAAHGTRAGRFSTLRTIRAASFAYLQPEVTPCRSRRWVRECSATDIPRAA